MLTNCMSLPYEEVYRMHRDGRIDDTDWMLYQFYWRNSAFHFSDLAKKYEVYNSEQKE